jgi:hypothetical protein
VMRLLDARRLHDFFTDKAIKSAVTNNNMIADSFNSRFLALPKGGYGTALQDNEIAVIYAALPAERFMSAPQLYDKFQKLFQASRDMMITTPSLVTRICG